MTENQIQTLRLLNERAHYERQDQAALEQARAASSQAQSATKNAETNMYNAFINERNAEVNAQNAATNRRNAAVNETNAGINMINATTKQGELAVSEADYVRKLTETTINANDKLYQRELWKAQTEQSEASAASSRASASEYLARAANYRAQTDQTLKETEYLYGKGNRQTTENINRFQEVTSGIYNIFRSIDSGVTTGIKIKNNIAKGSS